MDTSHIDRIVERLLALGPKRRRRAVLVLLAGMDDIFQSLESLLPEVLDPTPESKPKGVEHFQFGDGDEPDQAELDAFELELDELEGVEDERPDAAFTEALALVAEPPDRKIGPNFSRKVAVALDELRTLLESLHTDMHSLDTLEDTFDDFTRPTTGPNLDEIEG